MNETKENISLGINTKTSEINQKDIEKTINTIKQETVNGTKERDLLKAKILHMQETLGSIDARLLQQSSDLVGQKGRMRRN